MADEDRQRFDTQADRLKAALSELERLVEHSVERLGESQARMARIGELEATVAALEKQVAQAESERDAAFAARREADAKAAEAGPDAATAEALDKAQAETARLRQVANDQERQIGRLKAQQAALERNREAAEARLAALIGRLETALAAPQPSASSTSESDGTDHLTR